jgi:hypothetical protein
MTKLESSPAPDPLEGINSQLGRDGLSVHKAQSKSICPVIRLTRHLNVTASARLVARPGDRG